MNRRGYKKPELTEHEEALLEFWHIYKGHTVPPEAQKALQRVPPGLGAISGLAFPGKFRVPKRHAKAKRFRGRPARTMGRIVRDKRSGSRERGKPSRFVVEEISLAGD